MSQEPRKATDVLVDVESKVNMLLDIIRAQDLNIKVLSNKLNDVITKLNKQQAGPQKIMVETVQTAPAQPMPPSFVQLPAGDPERNIPVTAESKLPQDNSPQGFRRTSRPETFAGDNALLPHARETRPPTQIPQRPGQPAQMKPPPGRSEVTVPPEALAKNTAPPPPEEFTEVQPTPLSAQGQIPVMQRCVDKNGKSIFLAGVEIVDMSTSQTAFKTRTNGTGKWMASLGIGSYRVTVRKTQPPSKEQIEAVQDIHVDGSQNPLELPMLLIK